MDEGNNNRTKSRRQTDEMSEEQYVQIMSKLNELHRGLRSVLDDLKYKFGAKLMKERHDEAEAPTGHTLRVVLEEVD